MVFSQTDSIFMFMSTVLHPRHKLSYFRHAGWTADWIKTAEAIVRTTYEQRYKDLRSSDTVRSPFLDIRVRVVSKSKHGLC